MSDVAGLPAADQTGGGRRRLDFRLVATTQVHRNGVES